MKFFLTNHAVDRIKERFPMFCQEFSELKDWNIKDGLNNLYPIFTKIMEGCQENNSFLNNTLYMVRLYEKYGFDLEYKMMELKNESIVFVLAKKRSEKTFRIVTIVPNQFVPKVANKKFSDKKKKEEIIREKVLRVHDMYAESIKNFVQKKVVQKVDETFFDSEEAIKIAIANNQHKKINEEEFCSRYEDDIFTFKLIGDKIKDINKYHLFDKRNEPGLKIKKQFFNDFLDQKENIKLIIKFSNRVSVFEFTHTEKIYHIVFLKNKNDLQDKVKPFNKKLMFLENLEKT